MSAGQAVRAPLGAERAGGRGRLRSAPTAPPGRGPAHAREEARAPRPVGLPARSARAVAAILGLLAACGWADPAGAAPCVAFGAAGVPFYACVNGGRVGFWLSAGAQSSVAALLEQDEGGPFFLLSMDYEEDDRVGAWTAEADFVVTLRWDSAGPRRDELAVQFCGPRPVPVRIRFQGPPEPRLCGQWTTLLDGLDFPSAVARPWGR